MTADLLGRTQSLCRICLDVIPATIVVRDAVVLMEKSCPLHGVSSVVIANDVATYDRLCRAPRKVTPPAAFAGVRDGGCPNDCGLCSAHEQHTCLAIMEITSRCDLGCPICLADAVPGGRDRSPSGVESALRRLIETEGSVTPLQLSGGEPTQHPELEEIVRRASALGFRKIEIDTNGIALGRDLGLAERLRVAGLTGVYLQMDSLRSAALVDIRGKDLLEQKLAAIEHCRSVGLGVALSITVVPGSNDDELWTMVRFGMRERLTGVNFQPVALSGRYNSSLAGGRDRFTLGHFLQAIEAQSSGQLLGRELAPIPCPDTRCGVMTYALVRGETLLPLTRVVGADRLFDASTDLSDWDTLVAQLGAGGSGGCGCEGPCGPSDDLAGLLRGAECFSIGAHAMMDAWNFDLQRAKRCCVHELTPAGTLIPFCLYNIKYRATRAASSTLVSRRAVDENADAR